MLRNVCGLKDEKLKTGKQIVFWYFFVAFKKITPKFMPGLILLSALSGYFTRLARKGVSKPNVL